MLGEVGMVVDMNKNIYRQRKKSKYGEEWPYKEIKVSIFEWYHRVLLNYVNNSTRQGPPCPECGAELIITNQELSYYCDQTESTIQVDTLVHERCTRCDYGDTT